MAGFEEWRWEDPRWGERVGDDRAAVYGEALRRAVELRDTLAGLDSPATGRAVMLVGVLHLLGSLGPA